MLFGFIRSREEELRRRLARAQILAWIALFAPPMTLLGLAKYTANPNSILASFLMLLVSSILLALYCRQRLYVLALGWVGVQDASLEKASFSLPGLEAGLSISRVPRLHKLLFLFSGFSCLALPFVFLGSESSIFVLPPFVMLGMVYTKQLSRIARLP